jgi:hypothetical protein
MSLYEHRSDKLGPGDENGSPQRAKGGSVPITARSAR